MNNLFGTELIVIENSRLAVAERNKKYIIDCSLDVFDHSHPKGMHTQLVSLKCFHSGPICICN